MSQPQLAGMEDALMVLVENDATISGYQKTIATINTSNFEEDGRLLVIMPAFLFYMGTGVLKAPGINAVSYEYLQQVSIFLVQQNLRGPSDEKKGSLPGETGIYEMLDDLKRVLASARLTVAGFSGSKPLVILKSQSPVQLNDTGMVYELVVEIQSNWH